MQTTFEFFNQRLEGATSKKEQVVFLNPRLTRGQPCSLAQFEYIEDLCIKRHIVKPERWQLTKREATKLIRNLMDLDFEDFSFLKAN